MTAGAGVLTVGQAAEALRQRIEKAKNSPLAAPDVTLLGAAKAQTVATIREAIDAGIVDFGENRVQEAEAKWPELKQQYPHVRLHLIGPLQTNKVADAVALFDVIQTVDREKLADALVHEMQKQGKNPDCYIQVNTGAEEQKAGVAPEGVAALVDYARAKGLKLVGLMCVPPVGHHPAPHFALLAKLAKAQGLSGLSMGMSEDFEAAVRMGASCVRLGRVLFGERD